MPKRFVFTFDSQVFAWGLTSPKDFGESRILSTRSGSTASVWLNPNTRPVLEWKVKGASWRTFTHQPQFPVRVLDRVIKARAIVSVIESKVYWRTMVASSAPADDDHDHDRRVAHLLLPGGGHCRSGSVFRFRVHGIWVSRRPLLPWLDCLFLSFFFSFALPLIYISLLLSFDRTSQGESLSPRAFCCWVFVKHLVFFRCFSFCCPSVWQWLLFFG